MAYAHARPGERCAKCNDLAARVVAKYPLCVDHFVTLIDHCQKSIDRREQRRILIPPENPSALVDWGRRLTQAARLGQITDEEAADAWERARNAAA